MAWGKAMQLQIPPPFEIHPHFMNLVVLASRSNLAAFEDAFDTYFNNTFGRLIDSVGHLIDNERRDRKDRGQDALPFPKTLTTIPSASPYAPLFATAIEEVRLSRDEPKRPSHAGKELGIWLKAATKDTVREFLHGASVFFNFSLLSQNQLSRSDLRGIVNILCDYYDAVESV